MDPHWPILSPWRIWEHLLRPVGFNQELVQQFLDFMNGQHNDSSKCKREEELFNNKDGSKKTKPNIPDRYQSSYKDAHNIRSKQEKYGMNDSPLRRYTTFNDYLVPKPLEVNFLVLLTILLIKFLLPMRQIQQNNDRKLKRTM